jgi:hypothetical protein
MPIDLSPRKTQLLRGLGEFGIAGFLVALAAALALTAGMRWIDPAHWGLWVSPRMFLIGVVDHPGEGRELLGHSIYLLAFTLVPLCGLAARELYRAARQHISGALGESRGLETR